MTTTINWQITTDALSSARGIAFDGCHKIYVLLDDTQVDRMRSNGYTEDNEGIVTGKTPGEYLSVVQEWFEKSCGLRFVESIRTVDGDPNVGYTDLIAQFEQDDDADED